VQEVVEAPPPQDPSPTRFHSRSPPRHARSPQPTPRRSRSPGGRRPSPPRRDEMRWGTKFNKERRVYVGNLPFAARVGDLRELFRKGTLS
jgi:hypothetical protein